MKAVEWVRFFTDQRACHGKSVFSVTELANVADASQAVINVQLGRLVRRGLIRRWVPGRYGLPDGMTAEDLVAAIDTDAYVTGAYALARQGFITQQPREIDCFTRRRHNRSRRRNTPLGSLTFVCVSPRIHSTPAGERVAPPEQALCDLLYVLRRRRLDPVSLYTFRKLDQLVVPPAILARYPRTVQRAVESLIARAKAARLGGQA